MSAAPEFSKNYLWQICLAAFLLLLAATDSKAQLVKPFQPRVPDSGPSTSIYNINGDFSIIGNTNLTLENYSLNFQNNYPMVYVDADDDPQTLNSSSADLVFPNENGADPTCTRVVYAGLYWTGRSREERQFEVSKSGVTKSFDKHAVSFKTPGQTNYTTIRPENEEIWFPGSYLEQDGLFVGYADVTDLVQAAGQGEYWLADIALEEGTGGSIGFYGGWGMVIVYENPLMEARDVVVFDGYAYVASYLDDDYFLDLEGFSAVASGAVQVKMGMMGAEGERGGTGDYIEIEKGKNSGEFVRLSHEANDTFNFFNSSIYTGGNPRNPELINNTGIDLAVFELPNEDNSIIANGQSSTRIKYTTVIDTYVIYNITFSINARQTRLEAKNELGNDIQPINDVYQVNANEELPFRLEIRNRGQEPIEDARVEISLSALTDFSSVSSTWLLGSGNPGEAYFDASIGPGGSIIWEIGSVPGTTDPDELLGYLEYTLVSPDNCAGPEGFQCDTDFSLSGEVTGANAETGVAFSAPLIQGFPEDEDCPSSPNSGPMEFEVISEGEFCSSVEGVLEINLCELPGDGIPVSEIADNFPEGTKFYDAFPPGPSARAYDGANPFPKVAESREYFAVLEGDESCFRPFLLDYQSMQVSVSISSDYNGASISCQGASDGTAVATVEGGIPPYTFQWDNPGNSTTESVENLPEGTYTVTVTDSQSCSVTASITLQQPQPVDIQLDTQNSVFNLDCDGSDGGVVVFEVGGGSLPVKAALLSVGASGTEESVDVYESGTNRTFSFEGLLPGRYVIKASDANQCSSELAFEVQGIQPLSYSTSVSPLENCQEPESGAILIIPDGDADTINYLWSTGATTAGIEGLAAGDYSVRITDSFGCSREEQFTIAPLEPLSFAVSSATEVVCGAPGLKTTFFVELADEEDVDIIWSGGQSSADGREMVSSQPGSYTVSVRGENGCVSEQQVEVLPYALNAGFDFYGPDPTAGTPFFIADEIRFEAASIGNIRSYLWDFGDGTSSEEASPSHSYSRQGDFQVSLEVTDANGCVARESRPISIREFQIRMPDAFTPGSADGSNSHYFPVFEKIDGLEFWVYNKWGEVIFYTDDGNGSGWDGTVQGKEAMAGTYVYKLRYTAPDGSEAFRSGTFLLIR
ncbi:gliding motility-associated C-terminal domain-containing protein [Cyclobacterium lianum]|uniref:Gliding motility-associated C-terminal domain-containing protein n=1 Tax=Cyclobacterium lianum TaxID=388280 RepID=A0A1M7HT43_9BACT|nr:PKD domain-containing protein [Cyclobacterium lianum]SHM31644.1 gliding motility-associated C-terminal domain-containing protein [Cyclobacterium lianum]